MEYSMYVCPECRKVFKVKGNGKRVKCTKCADKLLIDLEIEEDKWVTYSRESKNSIIDEAIIGEEIIEVEEEETLEKTQNQRINDSNQSMQNSSLSEKKKDSKLSIVAAILGFFGGIWIFMVAGTVIAIVDLVKGKNDGKRHLGSYFCLVMAVCCLIVSLNSKSSTKKADENTAKNSSVTQTEQTSDKASEENTTDNSSTTKTEQASDTVTEENSKDTVNESQADSEESNSKKFGVNAAESTKDMRLGDIGEKSGIFVGLSYVKRMSYLQTALGKEDISTDNEVILGFFDFLNGMDKKTTVNPGDITCYVDGTQVEDVETYIKVEVDGVRQFYTTTLDPEMKLLSVQDFEVKKGWQEIKFFYKSDCIWTITQDDVKSEPFAESSMYEYSYSQDETPIDSVIYDEDFELTYKGFEMHTHDNIINGMESYAAFLFNINNTSDKPINYNLAGYNMRAYQNGYLLEDATFTLDDKIADHSNIFNIDSIEVGMNSNIYIAFKAQDIKGDLFFVYDDGYIFGSDKGTVYTIR